jgi:hypothetical protein
MQAETLRHLSWKTDGTVPTHTIRTANGFRAIRKGTSVNNGKNSDFWLHDVRFLRLKNVELGYSLPKELISKINVQRLRLYVSASNLFSIDNVGEYEIDPEIEARAAVVYPQQRTIMVGFNVTF